MGLNWNKTTEFGNYRDLSQNHKENYGSRRQASIITQVRNKMFLGKHIGSKSIKKLINHL
jgi:hypothetical protein